MAEPRFVDLKNATIKIKDGTPVTPLEITVKMGEGDLSWRQLTPREYLKDRGKLDAVRDGDEEPVEVTVNGRFTALISDTGDGPTPYEALYKLGAASAWLTTGAACDPYCVDLEVTVAHSSLCAGTKDEVITFPQFRVESLEPALKAGSLNFSGKCNVTKVTSVRV